MGGEGISQIDCFSEKGTGGFSLRHGRSSGGGREPSCCLYGIDDEAKVEDVESVLWEVDVSRLVSCCAEMIIITNEAGLEHFSRPLFSTRMAERAPLPPTTGWVELKEA